MSGYLPAGSLRHPLSTPIWLGPTTPGVGLGVGHTVTPDPGHRGGRSPWGQEAGGLATVALTEEEEPGTRRGPRHRAVGTGPVTVRMQGRPWSSGRRLTRKQPQTRQNETRLKEIHPECWGRGWPEMGKEGAASQPQLANRWDLPNKWREARRREGDWRWRRRSRQRRGAHRCLDGTRELLLAWGRGSFWKGRERRVEKESERLQLCPQEATLNSEAEGPRGLGAR